MHRGSALKTRWPSVNRKLLRKKYIETTSTFFSLILRRIRKRRIDVDISHIEITSKKYVENNVDFLLIDITSKKGRRNDVDFSPIEITSKKYVETKWKYVDIFFSTYWHNFNIESTSIPCVVSVGMILQYKKLN